MSKLPTNNARNVTGRRIKSIRMACSPKVSQEDLAGRMAARGVQLSQGQVAKIENGQRPVLDFELMMIARALRVPIQSLFE